MSFWISYVITKKKLPKEGFSSYYNWITENSKIIGEDILKNISAVNSTDNKTIICAVAGHVDYIISEDKDLLSLKEVQNIKIVTPESFSDIVPDIF